MLPGAQRRTGGEAVDDSTKKEGLDPAAVARLQCLGGPAFVCEMIDAFTQYVPGRLAEARAGLTRGDLPAVARCAHPVKSSAGNIGARRMTELAATIERLADAGETVDLPGLLKLLEAEYAAVAPILERLRRDLAP